MKRERNGMRNMEKSKVFRQTSMDRIQSPEQLNDYLRVTNPTVWVLLAAVIVLLAGMLVWGAFTYIGSFAEGSGRVENGVMTIVFEDDSMAKNVAAGMTAAVGDTKATISSVGYGTDGRVFAIAETGLADGVYQVRVSYKQTQIMKLLFN